MLYVCTVFLLVYRWRGRVKCAHVHVEVYVHLQYMYMTFITDGHIQCRHSVHVQLTGTVDLWDYLPRRMEGKCLEECRGCRVGEGGLGAHVLWSLGMTTWRNQMTSTRCSDPPCMYMYIHAHDRRPRDTTMSMQQEDNTAARTLGGMHMAKS